MSNSLYFLLGGYFKFETQSPIKIIYFFKYFMTLISSDKRRKYMKCLGYIKLKYPPPKKSLENCNIPQYSVVTATYIALLWQQLKTTTYHSSLDLVLFAFSYMYLGKNLLSPGPSQSLNFNLKVCNTHDLIVLNIFFYFYKN